MARQAWLEKLRRWIDDDQSITIQGGPNPRPPSKWEQFIVEIARELNQIMHREKFTPPGEPTYLPPEYIIFLSSEDDRQWTGNKRRGLERGLKNMLVESAMEVTGQQSAIGGFSVRLRVDGTLKEGSFRIQPVWDITEKTSRRKDSSRIPSEGQGKANPQQEVYFTIKLERHIPGESGSAPEVRPIFKREITIGRSKQSDVYLPDDIEISRHHATLRRNPDDGFTLICYGKNSVNLGQGNELAKNESTKIRRGKPFSIGSYELTVT